MRAKWGRELLLCLPALALSAQIPPGSVGPAQPPTAPSEIDKARDDGYKKGVDVGYANGHAAGRAAGYKDGVIISLQVAAVLSGIAASYAVARRFEHRRTTRKAGKTVTIFVSYRRDDTADTTGRISDRLKETFGAENIFKDVDSIRLGRDFRQDVHEAVKKCDVLIAVIGKQWWSASADGDRRIDDPRDHLRIEIEAALERDIPVIPVLVQGATLPSEHSLPDSLKSLAYRHAAGVRADPDFNHDIERLIRGIEAQFRTASG